MSNMLSNMEVLSLFGKVRRQLNLLATFKFKPLGFGPKQAALIRRLAEVNSTCAMDLARATQTDPAATGRVIDGLINKGWIKRTDDPNDRRRWNVTLTAKGEKVAEELNGLYREISDEFCKRLSSRQKNEFHALLNQMSNHLETVSNDVGDRK